MYHRDKRARRSSNVWLFKPIVLLTIVTSNLVSVSSAEPEIPAVTRQVTTVENNQFTAPYIPAFQTSDDGRIAIPVKRLDNRHVHIHLFNPEKLSGPFHDTEHRAELLSEYRPAARIDREALINSRIPRVSSNSITHMTFYDNPSSPKTNPYAGDPSHQPGQNSNDDYYDVMMLTFASWNEPRDNRNYKVPFYTPVTIEVSNPKTASAEITNVVVGEPNMGVPFRADAVFEPQITRDGRLLVMRIGTPNYVWTNPQDPSETITSFQDIVYAYRSDPEAFTGEGSWNRYEPISFAPHDERINNIYGFAAYPFRDPFGDPIPRGYDTKATYPWIDRDGDNLFYTTIDARLRDGNSLNSPIRYDVRGVESVSGDIFDNRVSGISHGTDTVGHIVMGLWTQGKMVTLDNLLNNIDYGIKVSDDAHIMLDLYEENPGIGGSGYVRIAAGRDNRRNQPFGAPNNTNFFESIENLFNYNDNIKPVTPRDVVWFVSNGTATEELAFDDYLNLDSFIVSHMNAAVSFGTNNPSNMPRSADMEYHDGWERGYFNPASVIFDNGGTALPERWNIPRNATTFGSANDIRVEPVAMGGIQGKGLWLDGDEGIRYQIPANQPQSFSDSNWYYGIYLDARFDNDQRTRTVIAFPDGSELRLRGRDEIIYFKNDNQHTLSLPGRLALPQVGWAHLALQVFEGGRSVDLYINGFLYDRWESATSTLFQLEAGGNLDIGAASNGFTGWVDEFKVFGQTFDPEVVANLAGGTLVGFNDEENTQFESSARQYPRWAHNEISERLEMNGKSSYDFYASHYDYTDDYGAHLGNIPITVSSVRDAILFPEGPLYHDAPRPDSAFNQFCLSCHGEESPHGLSISALEFDASTLAKDDPRRQPMQPEPTISGNIPANWLPGSPANAGVYDNQSIDEWLLPSVGDIIEIEPVTVANYQNDFASTPAPGWSYQWSRAEDLGSGNYNDLSYRGNRYQETFAQPGVQLGWARFKANELRTPSLGGNEYMIVSYEIQSGDGDGFYAIENTLLDDRNNRGNGADIHIYINHRPHRGNIVVPATSSGENIAMPLGELVVGDVITIAVGSNGDHRDDLFDFDFSIVNAGGN